MGKVLRKEDRPEETVHRERLRRQCRDYLSEVGSCTNPRVILGILPCVRNTNLSWAASSGEKCSILHKEADRQQNKRPKKGG